MRSRDYAETCKASQISIQGSGRASKREIMLEVLAWCNGHQQQIIPTGQGRMDMGSQIQTGSSPGLIQ
nr:MAG TPA: hypothetical protein [Caudoviricetes sp.]